MMYGLSLVVEVCVLLDPRKPFLKKLVVGSVFVDGFIAAARGVIHVFSPGKFTVETTFIVCLIPVVIYIADFALFYFVPPSGIQNGAQEDNLKDVDVEVYN